MARRDNGLPASSYVRLADVDEPLTEHVLDALREAGIAAYGEPLAGDPGPYRDVRPPDRPTARIFVDRTAVDRARDVVGGTLPGIRADFLADAALRADRRDIQDREVDEAWAGIVAGFDTTTADPVPRWPAQEDVDDSGEQPEEDPATDRPGSGLSARLVRRAVPLDLSALEDRDHEPEPEEPAEDPSDHYVPPHPPPLPRPADTVARFAWAGVLGGPLLLLLSTVLGLEAWVNGLAVAAFIAGFVTLIARMKDHHDDGWDDGAVV
ncbi:MAG: hypothetical protein R2737_04605 [Candidatus Nanopelagicales bacterium]